MVSNLLSCLGITIWRARSKRKRLILVRAQPWPVKLERDIRCCCPITVHCWTVAHLQSQRVYAADDIIFLGCEKPPQFKQSVLVWEGLEYPWVKQKLWSKICQDDD